MPYQINKFNGQSLVTIPDGTVDQTTDLRLIGKNYAGYGAIQNDNFVYLLENFASAGGPAKPVVGQIWFDTANKKLKFCDVVTNGIPHWRTTGGAEVATSQPSGLTTGDFWYNNSTNQLFAYNAATGQSYLIGPQAVAGQGQTDLVSISVLDNSAPTPVAHAIVKGTTNGVITFVVNSDAAFTLNASETTLVNHGFSHIAQGITLVNSTSGVTTTNFRFWGTASDSDKLGGVAASQYLQANVLTNVTSFPGGAEFPNSGITIGANSDIHVYIDTTNSNTATIENTYSTSLAFKLNNVGANDYPLILSGTTVVPGTTDIFDLGTGTKRWKSVYGKDIYADTITATTFSGAISGTATNADKLKYGAAYVSATDANTPSTIVARDASGNFIANIITATTTKARYADLAERYEADSEYEAGTVVVFGGEKEITVSDKEADTRIAGVVSTNPAYIMNEEAGDNITHPAIALRGKVPVKVVGPVSKGDVLINSNVAGHAMAANEPLAVCAASIIGKALEDHDGHGIVLAVV
jgi:hypothetical protein